MVKVLGAGSSAKFLAHVPVPGPNGAVRQSPIFRLPKREACLMAMSYSYELQARVYDRMVELEAAIQKPALPNFMDHAEAAIAWAGGWSIFGPWFPHTNGRLFRPLAVSRPNSFSGKI